MNWTAPWETCWSKTNTWSWKWRIKKLQYYFNIAETRNNMHMHVSSSASNYISQLISDLDPAASTVNYQTSWKTSFYFSKLRDIFPCLYQHIRLLIIHTDFYLMLHKKLRIFHLSINSMKSHSKLIGIS